MVFSSLIFLFVYLPVVLAVYYICPTVWRNPILLLFNLIFYGWGEPVFVLLMLGSVLVDYVLGIAIAGCKRKKDAAQTELAAGKYGTYAKLLLACSVLFNIGLLAYYKYFSAVLPVGISFYTFQKLSYTVDVYRGDCREQKRFVDFAVFVTLFPQLIAGPILQYKDLEGQLRKRTLSVSGMREGIRIFTVGLSKKVLLANSIGELWDYYRMLEPAALTTLGAWMGLVAFAFQIYFDFSGYSDMAVGLGKMLGFTFLENFRYPYISRSVTEFWRRWHISLSSWFRDYLYIPLGGNRRGTLRWMLNILIVWGATGIWHGAGVSFLLWGLYFGVLLMVEKLFLLKWIERLPAVVSHFYALVCILFGWAIFSMEDTVSRGGYIGALFGGSGVGFRAGDLFRLMDYGVLFLVLIVASLPAAKVLFDKLTGKLKGVIETVFILSGLLLSTAYLVDSTYNPFLYFRF